MGNSMISGVVHFTLSSQVACRGSTVDNGFGDGGQKASKWMQAETIRSIKQLLNRDSKFVEDDFNMEHKMSSTMSGLDS